MKPKNAPKSRKMHCLVGFFAAKTKQNRAAARNFGFAPKNFYRKISCLSPKFFGARCYTNFLRKIAVFHGWTVLCDLELVQAARIRREKPKFCLIYSVKQAVFLQKNGQKTAWSACGDKKGGCGGRIEPVLPSRGGVWYGGFCLGWPHFPLQTT